MGSSVSMAISRKENQRGAEAERYDQTLGKDRAAMRYGDTEAFVEASAQTSKNLMSGKAVKRRPSTMERAQKERRLSKMPSASKDEMKTQKNPKAKSKKGKITKGKEDPNWREKVHNAMKKSAWAFSITKALGGELEFAGAEAFVQNVPFYISEAFDTDLNKFTDKYHRVQQLVQNRPAKVEVRLGMEHKEDMNSTKSNKVLPRIRGSVASKPWNYNPTEKPKGKEDTHHKSPEKHGEGSAKKKKKEAEGGGDPRLNSKFQHTEERSSDILAEAEILITRSHDELEREERVQAINTHFEQVHEKEVKEYTDTIRDEANALQQMVNKANSRNLDMVDWCKPEVQDTSFWFKSEVSEMKNEVKVKMDELVAALMCGDVAVQILAAGATFKFNDGTRVPLWGADPYLLAERCLGKQRSEHVMAMRDMSMQHKGERGSVIEGLGLGVRHLLALVLAVEKAVGVERAEIALSKLKLVIHVSTENEQQVVEDLKMRNYFLLNPVNLIIVVQPHLPGYTYNSTSRCFEQDRTSPMRMYGTGYAFQQLTWETESYILTDPAGNIGKNVIKGSVLEHLKTIGVEWLLSNRLNDLRRLDPNHAIQVDVLTHTMQLRDRYGCAMTVQVEKTSSGADIELRGSVVLGRGAGQARDRQGLFCSEVPGDAVHTASMSALLQDIKTETGGSLYTSSDRYTFHLPTLLKAIGEHRFTPTIRLEEWEEQPLEGSDDPLHDTAREVVHDEIEGATAKVVKSKDTRAGFGVVLAVYPFFDMADMTSINRLRCMAVESKDMPDYLELKDERFLNDALGVCYTTDSNIHLHKLLKKLQERSPVRVPKLKINSMGANIRYNVLIFCSTSDGNRSSSLEAARMLPQFLVAGIDKVHLVHIVSEASQIPTRQKLLMRYEPDNPEMLFDKEVLIKPKDMGLVDFMCETAREKAVDLVVVGMRPQGEDKEDHKGQMGTISMNMVRKCRQSLFLFRLGCLNHETMTTQTGIYKPRSTWMVAAHQSSMPLLRFLSGLVNKRDDVVLIGRVTRTKDEEALTTRVLLSFSDAAVKEGIKHTIVQKFGPHPGTQLTTMATEEECDVLAFQCAGHLAPPDGVEYAVQHSACAIFIYKGERK